MLRFGPEGCSLIQSKMLRLRVRVPFQRRQGERGKKEEKTPSNGYVPDVRESMRHPVTSQQKSKQSKMKVHKIASFDPTTHNSGKPRKNKPFICSMESLIRQNIFPVRVDVFLQPLLWLTSVVCGWKKKKSLGGLSITSETFAGKVRHENMHKK